MRRPRRRALPAGNGRQVRAIAHLEDSMPAHVWPLPHRLAAAAATAAVAHHVAVAAVHVAIAAAHAAIATAHTAIATTFSGDNVASSAAHVAIAAATALVTLHLHRPMAVPCSQWRLLRHGPHARLPQRSRHRRVLHGRWHDGMHCALATAAAIAAVDAAISIAFSSDSVATSTAHHVAVSAVSAAPRACDVSAADTTATSA